MDKIFEHALRERWGLFTTTPGDLTTAAEVKALLLNAKEVTVTRLVREEHG